jgi:hypothetical protein
VPKVFDVSTPIGSVNQEMKDGAIVPQVHRRHRPIARDVRDDPIDRRSPVAKALPSSRHSGRRNIEDGYAL